MNIEIIHDDCLYHMKTMDDNSVDCIVTDSPYGISFMGKGWDKGIPPTEYWKEMLRIVKPGSHILAAGLPRMLHRLTCAIEDSGWVIRDLLMHIFGSGFPKSHNNFGISGYGTALKPAWEGWILAMKPLDGTFKQNALKWGVAGINIDACRIGIGKDRFTGGLPKPGMFQDGHPIERPTGARWPANLILDEEAAAQLDQMTGHLKTGHRNRENHKQSTAFWDSSNRSKFKDYDDSGGASRFFYCAKASSSERNAGLEGVPLKETSGCYGEFEGDGRGRQTEHSPRQNTHPCIKPIKLMEYLIKLIMPTNPNAIVLDPFLGSGSTLVAAKQLGFNAIGIEKEAEYVEIARKRVDFARTRKDPLATSDTLSAPHSTASHHPEQST